MTCMGEGRCTPYPEMYGQAHTSRDISTALTMLCQWAHLCTYRHTNTLPAGPARTLSPKGASAHTHACVLGMLCTDPAHVCMHIPPGLQGAPTDRQL